MIRRLLLFSSICLPIVTSAAIPGTLPPIYPQPQPRAMQSANTQNVCDALRRAKSNFEKLPRTTELNWHTGKWEKKAYGINDLIGATENALKNRDLVCYTRQEAYPRPIIIARLVHTQSGEWIESEMAVSQGRNGTSTQAQYIFAWAYTYATLLGLACPIENTEGAQEAAAPNEAPQN